MMDTMISNLTNQMIMFEKGSKIHLLLDNSDEDQLTEAGISSISQSAPKSPTASFQSLDERSTPQNSTECPKIELANLHWDCMVSVPSTKKATTFSFRALFQKTIRIFVSVAETQERSLSRYGQIRSKSKDLGQVSSSTSSLTFAA